MYGSATVRDPFRIGARSKNTRLDILIRSVSEKIVRRIYAGSPRTVLNNLRSYGVQFLANTIRYQSPVGLITIDGLQNYKSLLNFLCIVLIFI